MLEKVSYLYTTCCSNKKTVRKGKLFKNAQQKEFVNTYYIFAESCFEHTPANFWVIARRKVSEDKLRISFFF